MKREFRRKRLRRPEREKKMMRRILLIGLMLAAFFVGRAASADDHPGKDAYDALKKKVIAEFSEKTPKEWGETVTGVKTRLATNDRVIALTLDACGSPHGKGFDATADQLPGKGKNPRHALHQ